MNESELPPDDRDPDDADLIAYLDGELGGQDARAVESQMALDPSTRDKADAYRKTYDLLDFLPKPEPSPDFTARTLTKLQPAITTGTGESSKPSSPIPTVAGGTTTIHQRPRTGWLNLAWAFVAAFALGSGYLAHAALRPYLAETPRAENLSLSDLRVIEHLPLYIGVDDLEFAKQLDAPDLFGPDPNSPTTSPNPTGSPRPESSSENRDKLIALFVSYTPARQQQLRQLDLQLTELPAPDRDRLFRVLEQYAIWLDRISPADRKDVLAAPGPVERLEQIRQTKVRLWRESLPAPAKEQLKLVANPEERVRLVAKWKQAELSRNEEWALARRQWELLNRNPTEKPWPFNDAEMVTQVDSFIRTVLRADLNWKLDAKMEFPQSCRLSRDEFLELKLRYEATTREGYWMLYGACILKLAERHPGLPEPVGKSPITDFQQLPNDLVKDLRFKKMIPDVRRNLLRGKWPDFALEIAQVAQRTNTLLPEPLGPCRPGQFAPRINDFLRETLTPMLTEKERTKLQSLEGKWPEYPRAMIDLARQHDLAVPGVTLPGPPSMWTKYYGSEPAKR